MKKKLVMVLMAMVLTVECTSCTAKEPAESQASSGITGETISGESIASTAEGSREANNEGAGSQEVSKAEPKYMLSYGYEAGEIALLNDDGASLTKFDWKDIKDRCKAKGYDMDEATLCMIDNGTIYLRQYELSGDRYVGVIYAIKLDTFDIKRVYGLPNDAYLDRMDFYDGKLYIDVSSYEDGKSRCKEVVFEKDPKDLSFLEIKTQDTELLSAIDYCDQVYCYSTKTETDSQSCSLARCFDEVGFVIGKKDGNLVKILSDGSMSLIPGFDDSDIYVRAYDKNFLAYDKYDENWNSVLYFVDLNTGIVKSVERSSSAPTQISFLALEDGALYYCEQETKVFIQRTNQIRKMDMASGASKLLYEESTVPGAASMEPGTQHFQIHQGKIYYLGVEGNESKWFCVDASASNVERKAIGTMETIGTFQYGSVICDVYLRNCPYCGIELEKYYGEAFQLDEKYSKNAAAINEKLASDLKTTIENYRNSEAQMQLTDEECEYHLEYPVAYCESDEDYVSKVTILNDKYLLVDTDGYWYGGGAHGQPYMGQKIFDLTTGEYLQFKDFYQGTEEDFKKLVAKKTQEDFCSYSDYESPYFASDEEEVYNEAYETANIETTMVHFDEEGAWIVFQPYEMGPFAAGFIEIRISYQELLGRDHL